MTRHSAAPPYIAQWLASLVAAPEQTATIVGDLLEEVSSIHECGSLLASHRQPLLAQFGLVGV